MINPPKATKAPTIQRKSIMDWSAGTVTDYDARRLSDNALVEATNLNIEQNGVVRPRPSLALYGPQPPGKILGEVFECKVMENNRPVFYLVAMIVVEEEAGLYYTTGEDNAWSRIGTQAYNNTASVRFLQVQGKILVLNGVDTMSFIDTTNWEITTFAEIGNPETAPRLVEARGLTGNDIVVYYAITANSTVGETSGSPVLSQHVSTPRDLWDKDTQSVQIAWDPVEGATSYNVYMAAAADGTAMPDLMLVASKLTVTTFTDDGTAKYVLSAQTMPNYNSTAGPKAKRGAVINGRVWLVEDTVNPHLVHYGGDYESEFDFSPANGGGFFAVANGTKEIPIAILPFRRGSGENTVVVLTQGSNGSGKRYHVSKTTLSYGNESLASWELTEDSGTDGTDSPDGVVIYQNSLYYPSRDGFKTTGTIPQLQNVLSTTSVSNTIRNQVSLLNTNSMNKAVGLAYEGKIYWSLPFGSDKNNRIWILDLEHKGAWLLSWYVSADWMWLYNDNSGVTHFLILSDDKIYELNRTFATSDDSRPFMTKLESGDIKWSKDGRDWANLLQVVFTFLKIKGKLTIEVTGYTEDGKQTWQSMVDVAPVTYPSGWSELARPWGSLRPWSDLEIKNYNDVSENDECVDIKVEVDEDVQYFTYRITSTESGVDYTLSSVVAEYVGIGIKDLS